MKALLPIIAIACFAVPADAQIFKRRVVRCNGNQCRVVHHPVVHHPQAVRVSAGVQVSARSVSVASTCIEERNAWVEADNAVDVALVARGAARAADDEAAAAVQAAEEALAAAQARKTETSQNLTQATANVVTAANVADEAYKRWVACVIQ